MRAQLLAATFAIGVGFAAGAQAQQAMPPQLTYQQPLPPPGVRAVQQRLQQNGFYQGQLDGIWGADSVVALQRFQQTHGLLVTGQLNQATVATLGLDPDSILGVPQATAAATPEALSPWAVRQVQGRLQRLGFYRGSPDGIWGPGTQSAIAQFQQSHGLQPNSQLNPATIASLGMSAQELAER